MEIFERINRAFGGWYEGLFGGSDDVRPKDILRKILVALEEHRKEGFDSRIYVPNQYILEIAVDDAEEKEYLLSFLDRDELGAAIRRYCQQNHYHIRGALDFTIKEVETEADGKRRGKARLPCRRHASIEMDSDGRFTLYDLDTTNGTRVNGRRIDNRTLSSQDEILIGATRIIFHQDSGSGGVVEPARQAPSGRAWMSEARPRPARLVLTDGERDLDEYVL